MQIFKLMKSLLRLSFAILLCLSFLVGFGSPQAAQAQNAADLQLQQAAGKIDLNNASVRAFRQFPGMYPTLASKIVQSGPFNRVDDVFNIPGLSDGQKSTLGKYVDQFTVTPPTAALNAGFDRINPGAY
jgi:photosystem II PsbU protein